MDTYGYTCTYTHTHTCACAYSFVLTASAKVEARVLPGTRRFPDMDRGFRFTLSLPNNVRGTNGDCEFDKAGTPLVYF